MLRQETESRAEAKKYFLPDERAAMVTDDESEQILQRSFEYLIALMEFNHVTLKFQIRHYLFNGFKTELRKTFKNRLMNEADWATLVEPDQSLALRLSTVKAQIKAVQMSLQEVERLQRRMM